MSDGAEYGLHVAVPGVLAALGLCMLAASIKMGNPLHQPLGPGLVPTTLSISLLAGAVVDLIPALRRLALSRRSAVAVGTATEATVEGAATASDGTIYTFPARLGRLLGFLGGERDWILCTVGLLLGVYIWSVVGFIIGVALCVMVMILVDRSMRLRAAVVFTAVLMTSTWLLFVVALNVSLG